MTYNIFAAENLWLNLNQLSDAVKIAKICTWGIIWLLQNITEEEIKRHHDYFQNFAVTTHICQSQILSNMP